MTLRVTFLSDADGDKHIDRYIAAEQIIDRIQEIGGYDIEVVNAEPAGEPHVGGGPKRKYDKPPFKGQCDD